MAEPELSLEYDDLLKEVGYHLGYSRNTASYSSGQTSFIEDIIAEGIRWVLYPPVAALEAAGARKDFYWSFLQVAGTLNIVDNDWDYDLPDDFGGNLKFLAGPEGSEEMNAVQVPVDDLLSYINDTAEATHPLYFAVRPKAVSGSTGQRWEVLVYPEPSASKALPYTYSVNPDALDASGEHPYGGPQMAHVYVAACKAVAEQWLDDEQGPFYQWFIDALAGAIRRDDNEPPRDALISPTVADSLSSDFTELRSEIGFYIGVTGSPRRWSHGEEQAIYRIINAGLNLFYNPPAIEGFEGYIWSFLVQEQSVGLTNGNADEDLSSSAGSIVGDFYWNDDDQKRRIEMVDIQTLRQMQSMDDTDAPPEYVALLPKSSDGSTEQVWEAEFFPKPNGSLTVYYAERINPDALNATDKYALGSRLHAGAIRAACFAEAEFHQKKEYGSAYEKFLQQLRGAMALDRRLHEPSKDTYTQAATSSESMAYLDFAYEVGDYMDYGANPAVWSENELRRIDAIVVNGCRRYYEPTFPPDAGIPDDFLWSFLIQESTFNTVADQKAYAITTNAAITGRMYGTNGDTQRTLKRVSVDALQAMSVKETDTNAYPEYFAVRAKSSDGSSEQSYEVLLFPVPDDAYTLYYEERVNPPRITSTNKYPLGARQHSRLVLEACLAEAELKKTGAHGPHHQRFVEHLVAAAKRDLITQSQNAMTWQQSSFTSLEVQYNELLMEASRLLGTGSNPETLSEAEFRAADDLVNRGYRLFIDPPLGEGFSDFVWSFLVQEATISLANTTDTYDLSNSSGVIVGKPYWADGDSKRNLERVSVDRLHAMQSMATANGDPTYYAVRAKSGTGGSSQQDYEIVVHPVPDGSATLYLQHRVATPRLTASNLWPYGGRKHSQLILEAIRAEHDAQTMDKFLAMARQAAAEDMRILKADSESWPNTNTSPSDGSLLYDDLAREAGRYFEYGPNAAEWSYAQQQHVDTTVHSGLRRFEYPPILEGQQRPHEWGFLKPNATLTITTDGTEDYDLPSDYHGGMIDEFIYSSGDVARSVAIIDPDDLLAMRANDPKDGFPTHAAIRPKAFTKGTGQRYEVLFYPKPNTETLFTGTLDTARTANSGIFLYRVTAEAGDIFRVKATVTNDGGGTFKISAFDEYNTGTTISSGASFNTTTTVDHTVPDNERVSAFVFETVSAPDDTVDVAFTVERCVEDTYTLNYRYPVALSQIATSEYPHGGKVHAETIKAAVLAEAELSKHGERRDWWAVFERQLASSIAVDRDQARIDSKVQNWAASRSGNYSRVYYDIAREVGGFLGFGFNPDSFTEDEQQQVESAMRSGASMFYNAFDWTFLKVWDTFTLWQDVASGTATLDGIESFGATFPGKTLVETSSAVFFPSSVGAAIQLSGGFAREVTDYVTSTKVFVSADYSGASEDDFTVTADGVYQLPDDCGGLCGSLVFQDESNYFDLPIANIGEVMRRRERDTSYTGRPQIGAIRPRAANALRKDFPFNGVGGQEIEGWQEQRFELAVYPRPDADYTMNICYWRIPRVMTPERGWPLGGERHGEAIKAACLAAAEEMRGGRGDKYARYQEHLKRSIETDRRAWVPDTLGVVHDPKSIHYQTRAGYRRSIGTETATYNGSFSS